MNHALRIQPAVVNSQQLTVVGLAGTVTTMGYLKEKTEFAERMNLVADKLKVPPKGKNRQQSFGKMFGVTQEAARKWLEGESMPQIPKCIEIAKTAGISFEWLMTGRGEMITAYIPESNTPEHQILLLMENMDEATKYKLIKIGDTLIEPEKNGGAANG